MFEQFVRWKCQLTIEIWSSENEYIHFNVVFLWSIHHLLYSCQRGREVRSKGIRVVSLIALLEVWTCREKWTRAHVYHCPLTKANWANYLDKRERETDIQWSNEQISPYGFFENMYVACRIIEANEVEKNAHHYLPERCVLVHTLQLITTEKWLAGDFYRENLM